MKNATLVITLSLTILSLTSCEKDESSTNPIIGEWRMTETHTDNGVAIYDVLGQDEILNFSYQGTDYNATTTFTENPNEFTSSGYYKYEYISSFMGETDTMILQADSFLGVGQWSIEGDTLFQTFSGANTKNVILELTNSIMRFRTDVNTAASGVPTTATVFTTFEKN